MRFHTSFAAIFLALASGAMAQAETVAYWRFEEGPDQANVPHSTDPGVFEGTIHDVSGNGNTLSVWEAGGGAGYTYRADVPSANVPQTGATNSFSVKNTGGGPAMFTDTLASNPSGTNVETMMPATFTVEASYKPENGGHRTIVGRDAQNVVAGTDALAAFYLQVRPDNSVGVGFADVTGKFHEAYSAPGLIKGFDFPTDNDGLTGKWYNLATVSDGVHLKMYVNNLLVATTALETEDASLAVGTTNGSDWHAGEWSVGRGLFNGGHGDRAYGFIDEVRISDSSLLPSQFLTPTQLSMSVDKTTGEIALTNTSTTPANIDFYRIASASGALSTANWNSLDDQNFSAVDGPDADSDAGNSPGEGWDEAGGSNANQLVEQFLADTGSTIAPNETLSLGNAFNTAFSGDPGDLEFTYSVNGGDLVSGILSFGGIAGDFDDSGKVDGADYLLWQRNFGQTGYDAESLAQWKANFGDGPAEAAAAIPEPASIGLIALAGAGLATLRRRL